jgi:hypothetical protein
MENLDRVGQLLDLLASSPALNMRALTLSVLLVAVAVVFTQISMYT